MSKYVPIRFNDQEEAMLLRSFAGSTDTALGAHIKRVFFNSMKADGEVLRGIRDDLDRIDATIHRLRAAEQDATDQGLMLSIVCGLYVMLRKSVSDSVRAQADLVLDVGAIEEYLRVPK